MRPVSLNLASKPLRNQLVPGIILTLLAVGALFLTLFNAVGYTMNARAAAEVSREISERRENLETLSKQREMLQGQLGRLDLEDMERRSGVANGLLLRRGLHWTRLFNELEAVQPYHVRLYSVRPSIGKDGVQLVVNGAAQTIDDELEYIDRLEASELFGRTYPRSEVPDRDTIRFTLVMEYYPDRAAALDAHAAADGPSGQDGALPALPEIATAVSTPQNLPEAPADGEAFDREAGPEATSVVPARSANPGAGRPAGAARKGGQR